MTMMGMRDDLAVAVSTVGGIKGYAQRPPAPRPGDAWPMFVGLERDSESGQFFHQWRVIVMVPQDEGAALIFTDSHLEPLLDALEPHIYVERAGPARLQTGAGELMILEINGRGE